MNTTNGHLPMMTRNALAVAMMAVASFAFGQELDESTVAKGAAFSRRAAAESMVLLKNEGATLPLAQGGKIALYDVTGKYRAGGGGSSDVKAVRVVDIPSGLKEAGFVLDPQSRETAVVVIERASRESHDNSEEWFELSKK